MPCLAQCECQFPNITIKTTGESYCTYFSPGPVPSLDCGIEEGLPPFVSLPLSQGIIDYFGTVITTEGDISKLQHVKNTWDLMAYAMMVHAIGKTGPLLIIGFNVTARDELIDLVKADPSFQGHARVCLNTALGFSGNAAPPI